jgi:signal peptidase I
MKKTGSVIATISIVLLIILYVTLWRLGVSKLIMPFSVGGFVVASVAGIISSIHMIRKASDTNPPEGFVQELTDWIRFLSISTLIIMTVFTFVIFSSSVSGDSMEDTLHDEDRILVYLFDYVPQRSHVIVLRVTRTDYGHINASHFRDDDGTLQDTVYFIKRVVGMPGDAVGFIYEEEIEGYRLTIGGVVQKTPEGKLYDITPEARDRIVLYSLNDDGKLMDGQFLLFGDHVEVSGDSGDFGAFHEDDIVGRAIVRLWPFGGIS